MKLGRISETTVNEKDVHGVRNRIKYFHEVLLRFEVIFGNSVYLVPLLERELVPRLENDVVPWLEHAIESKGVGLKLRDLMGRYRDLVGSIALFLFFVPRCAGWSSRDGSISLMQLLAAPGDLSPVGDWSSIAATPSVTLLRDTLLDGGAESMLRNVSTSTAERGMTARLDPKTAIRKYAKELSEDDTFFLPENQKALPLFLSCHRFLHSLARSWGTIRAFAELADEGGRCELSMRSEQIAQVFAAINRLIDTSCRAVNELRVLGKEISEPREWKRSWHSACIAAADVQEIGSRAKRIAADVVSAISNLSEIQATVAAKRAEAERKAAEALVLISDCLLAGTELGRQVGVIQPRATVETVAPPPTAAPLQVLASSTSNRDRSSSPKPQINIHTFQGLTVDCPGQPEKMPRGGVGAWQSVPVMQSPLGYFAIQQWGRLAAWSYRLVMINPVDKNDTNAIMQLATSKDKAAVTRLLTTLSSMEGSPDFDAKGLWQSYLRQ
jgi:hypothetical protein